MKYNHSYNKNPFAFEHWGVVTIGFWVPYKAEPLWWIGTGFKDLTSLQREPTYFDSMSDAENLIKNKLLDFIKQYRSDQINLIKGW